MSPLTKLFVVLSVLMSLLLTSGMIVYVNKQDVQKEALDKTKAERDRAVQDAASARQQLETAQQNLLAVQQQANSQANGAAAAYNKAQDDISKLQVSLAQNESGLAVARLDNSRLTEAVNASQTAAGKLSEEVARLRTNNDTLVKQSSDLNSSVSDLTNKLDVTERERRMMAEQLTQTKGENQRMGAVIKGANLSPQQQALAVNRSGTPNINGVVRDVRTIAGNQYATISVGSADSVTRGMEFKVLDRASGNFLGTLVVDSVEPNEATGRLSGPNVAAIRPGVEVRTQL